MAEPGLWSGAAREFAVAWAAAAVAAGPRSALAVARDWAGLARSGGALRLGCEPALLGTEEGLRPVPGLRG